MDVDFLIYITTFLDLADLGTINININIMYK